VVSRFDILKNIYYNATIQFLCQNLNCIKEGSMSKSSKKPIEGTVKNAWLNMKDLTGNCTVLGELHVVLEEYPEKEFTFNLFFLRIDKGEKVRIWEQRSHPKLDTGGNALQIIDENGEVKFTIGRSGYYASGGRCNYSFKPEHLN
jgi:hypothetical protein